MPLSDTPQFAGASTFPLGTALPISELICENVSPLAFASYDITLLSTVTAGAPFTDFLVLLHPQGAAITWTSRTVGPVTNAPQILVKIGGVDVPFVTLINRPVPNGGVATLLSLPACNLGQSEMALLNAYCYEHSLLLQCSMTFNVPGVAITPAANSVFVAVRLATASATTLRGASNVVSNPPSHPSYDPKAVSVISGSLAAH